MPAGRPSLQECRVEWGHRFTLWTDGAQALESDAAIGHAPLDRFDESLPTIRLGLRQTTSLQGQPILALWPLA